MALYLFGVVTISYLVIILLSRFNGISLGQCTNLTWAGILNTINYTGLD